MTGTMMEAERRVEMMRAMLAELGEKGYRDASVCAALGRTGASAEEFEAEFGDKDGCLFAAYERLSAIVTRRVREGAVGIDAAWPDRVRAGLVVLLREIAAHPELAQTATRTFPAIGPEAYRRYVDFVSSFEELMREGREYSGLEEQLPGEVELLAVGAAEAIIFGEVDARRAERLPAMAPEILFSVLVPFLGAERAAEKMREASEEL